MIVWASAESSLLHVQRENVNVNNSFVTRYPTNATRVNLAHVS